MVLIHINKSTSTTMAGDAFLLFCFGGMA